MGHYDSDYEFEAEKERQDFDARYKRALRAIKNDIKKRGVEEVLLEMAVACPHCRTHFGLWMD